MVVPSLTQIGRWVCFFNISCSATNGKAKVEEKAPVIKAYLNPYCPWSPGVRTVLDNAGLAYDILDITQDREAYAHMVEKSRQYSSPCVEVDGHMLADVGGEEVEAWLRQHGLV